MHVLHASSDMVVLPHNDSGLVVEECGKNLIVDGVN